ncbi:MAG: hypothetical protein EXR00_03960 [Alphaproteobacteria bacterium]|nr:hypothetical protein [Alphaproteobacteria bacterium]
MKRLLSIRVLLQAVTGLLTLALVAVCAFYAIQTLKTQEEAQRIPALIDLSNDLFGAAQNFRLERGNANTALMAPVPVGAETKSDIAALRQRSAEAIDSALVRLEQLEVGGLAAAIENIRTTHNDFQAIRREVDMANTCTNKVIGA